jgi:phosphomannomutase
MTDTQELAARTREWVAGDPDPRTSAELEALLAGQRWEELEERMAGTLEFGTAGLRGRVEGGSNRMNRAVVIRATYGVARWILDDEPGHVVVGRDARLSSEQLMEDTVGVLAAMGIPVRYFAGTTPTPIVAYAALASGARAAIVVTASHNPPWDNGYKVYDVNGAQIIPPVDSTIAANIAEAPPATRVPRLDAPYEHELVEPMPADARLEYLAAISRRHAPGRRPLKIVHTPLHGVGGAAVTAALTAAGHEVVPVEEQFEPDGRFPTVEFPNPEEPGALDLALALARDESADLVIANDPDTDRLAVAVPGADGIYRPLSGNQIGVLLADHLLGPEGGEGRLVLNTVVSTPMLGSIAEHAGASYHRTLTGFKWIWNAALDLEAAGEGSYLFGFEEALGYCVDPVVRDKDGIAAALSFADLAAAAADRGALVDDVLAELYLRHGLWVSRQRSIVREGTAGADAIAAAMERLSADPPQILAGHDVVEFTDYAEGAEDRPRWLPATSLVELGFEGGSRLLVRPSGTEPKLKIYADWVAQLEDVATWRDEEVALLDAADTVIDDLAARLDI